MHVAYARTLTHKHKQGFVAKFSETLAVHVLTSRQLKKRNNKQNLISKTLKMIFIEDRHRL